MTNSRTLQILLKLRDDASKQLDSFRGKVNDMQPAFRKMAAVGTAGLVGITAGVMNTVKAYSEQERAEARLAQIATQVTGANAEQIKSYKALARQLQAVGVVGDEVIIAGQSQIASFTKNADVVSLLSDDLADLAVATYGTNVSQEQMIQTSNMLGRALTGQLGALTRTGILVSDDYRKAFESANSEMERAEIISKIVADNYGGLNEAMRETTEGQLQVMRNAFSDLREELGASFIPMITKLMQTITPLIQRFSAWATENPKLILTITLATAGLFGLLTVVGLLGMALPILMSGFAILFSPVTLVVGAIAGLVALFFIFRDEIVGFFANIFEGTDILNNLKYAFDVFKETVSMLWGEIKRLWDLISPVLMPVLKFLAQVIGVTIVGAFKILGFYIKTTIDTISWLIKAGADVVSFFGEKIPKAIDFVVSKFERLIQIVQNAIELIAESGIGKAIGGAFSGVRNLFGGRRNRSVDDAIISPRGDIITTHPDDYIIATKTPETLGAGGGGVTIQINTMVGEEEFARKMGDNIMKELQHHLKFSV